MGAKFVHTTPVVVKVNDQEIEKFKKLLIARDYSSGMLSGKGEYIFTYGDKFYTGTEDFYKVFEKSKKSINKDFKGFINCGEDKTLFLMIANIRNDDKDRWCVFISDDLKTIDICGADKWSGNKNFHKASVLELLQKFAPDSIPDYMKK